MLLSPPFFHWFLLSSFVYAFPSFDPGVLVSLLIFITVIRQHSLFLFVFTLSSVVQLYLYTWSHLVPMYIPGSIYILEYRKWQLHCKDVVEVPIFL